jgi:hypothetical protein
MELAGKSQRCSLQNRGIAQWIHICYNFETE